MSCSESKPTLDVTQVIDLRSSQSLPKITNQMQRKILEVVGTSDEQNEIVIRQFGIDIIKVGFK